MRASSVICLVLALVCYAAALYGAKSDVIMLSKSNIAKHFASGTNDVWLIEFFAPWCGHCKSLAPQYESAAKTLKGIVKLGAIDCDVEKELCGAAGIQGFPTIKTWDGKSMDKKGPKMNDYQGAREASALVAAGRALLQSKATVLKGAAELDSWFAAKPELPHVLLISDKDKTADLYKAVSMQYADRASFAQINGKKAGDVAAKYGVGESFPRLLAFVKSSEEPVVFSEALSVAAVKTWVESIALPAPQGAGAGQQDAPPKKEAAPKKSDELVITRVRTDAEFEEACGSKPMGSCFIAAFSPEEEDHQKLYDAFAAAAKRKNNFHFVWVDGVAQAKLCDHFNLRSGLPAAVVYSPTKQVAAPFVGAWDVDSLAAFMGSVGTGRVRLSPVKALPPFAAESAGDKKSEL